jgi:hypothetical protein
MSKAFTVTFTVEYATQVALGLVGAGAVTEDVTVVEHDRDGDVTHTVSYLDLAAWAAGGGL